MNNGQIVTQAAAFKKESRSEFEEAVSALIALAFRYSRLGANFLWTADPALEREANAILRGLSDNLAEKAKARALALISGDGWDYGEDAWEDANERVDVPVLTRFDQQGSFLRELLEIWIAIAFVEKMTQAYLKICVLRYLSNPYASPLWRGLPAGLLKHGPGFQRNIIDQLALIGQDAIVSSVRLAEWMDASSKGATYYIRRRGSNYKCEECEGLANRPIPIEVPWDFTHARCLCWPEYHYEPIEL